jgi:hypothetical protein
MTKSLEIKRNIQEALLDDSKRADDIRFEEKGTRRITVDLTDNKKVSAPYVRWTGYYGEDHCLEIVSGHETDYQPCVVWCCSLSSNMSGWGISGIPGTYDWLVKYKGEMTYDEAKAVYKKLSTAVNKNGTLAEVTKIGDWEKLEGKTLPTNKSDLNKMKEYLDKTY